MATAVAVGGLVAFEPVYAAVLVFAVGLAFLVATSVTALPVFLVFTMFAESLALGPGLTIGRLAGALALAVLAYYLLVKKRTGLRANALMGASAAYGVWILASVYWASDSSYVYTAALSYLLAVAYMLSFAVIVRSHRQLKAVLAKIALGSLAFGLLAFTT